MLDGTVVAAPLGVLVNVASTGAVVGGYGLALASAGDLAKNAAGADRVDPVSVGSGHRGVQYHD